MIVSLLNRYGVSPQEWKKITDILVPILISDYGVLFKEEDCGSKLCDILTDDFLQEIALKLAKDDQVTLLNEIAIKELGFTSTYHIGVLIGEMMLVGDGECPFCGSNDIKEVDGYLDGEYDNDEGAQSYYQPPLKICQSCGHEWSTEE